MVWYVEEHVVAVKSVSVVHYAVLWEIIEPTAWTRLILNLVYCLDETMTNM